MHMTFSYMNLYVSWIHILIRVYQGSRCPPPPPREGEQRFALGPAAHHPRRARACAIVPLSSADLAVADSESQLSALRRPPGRCTATRPVASRGAGSISSGQSVSFLRRPKAGINRKNGVLRGVDGNGRRPAAVRRRSLPGPTSEPARATMELYITVHLCFVWNLKYDSESPHLCVLF